MRSSRNRPLEPLNFTPDEPAPARSGSEERGRQATPPKPRPKSERAQAFADTGALAGLSPATRRGAPDIGVARHAYLFAWVAALAWAGMLLAYTIGYVGGVAGLFHAPMQLAVVSLMTVLPAVFILVGAYAVRQGARLAAEARWTRTMAEDFVTPAVLASARVGDIAEVVRGEVERVSASAIAAHGQLITVREALSTETERLGEAAAQAQHTARVIGETLTRERQAMAELLAQLNHGAEGLAAGVERQSRLVGEASDLARSQLHEAEATLASGAGRIATASSDAGQAGRKAAEDLTHQAERLDIAAAALSERLRFLEPRLTEQRTALSNLLHTLGADQDDLAVQLETHRAHMLEVIAEARASVAELGGAASIGGDALRQMIATAVDQTREIATLARQEQGALRAEASEARMQAQSELHRALDALARAGEDARRAMAAAADQAQAAAGARVGAAKAEVEQLGELAFTAGQRADQAFQARLGDARRLIEQTAALVEEAGNRAGERIETGLGASRSALGELASALGDIDAQLARLPGAAREHAEAVRVGVERSLGELNASARRVAEETQGLDAAFQDRIRRNYEALSEAVRLMSRVAGAVDFSRDLAPPRAAPPPVSIPPLSISPLSSSPFSAPFLSAAPPPVSPASIPPVQVSAPSPSPPPAADSFANLRRAAEPAARLQPAAAAPARQRAQVFGRAPNRDDDAVQPVSANPAESLLEPELATSTPRSAAADPNAELRPRLKLTPTDADQALKAVFARPEPEAATSARDAQGRSGWDADLDEWTWKDLLTSMDDAPTDTDALAEQMIREVETLGVDATALLPRTRVEDIAAAMGDADGSAARDTVRRLAPAAIRRLSRRVLTDRPLREQVERYVGRYQGLVATAAGRGGNEAAALLATDAGRAYLLLDAAVGDL